MTRLKILKKEVLVSPEVFEALKVLGHELRYRNLAVREVIDKGLKISEVEVLDAAALTRRLPFSISNKVHSQVNETRISLPDGFEKDFKTAYNQIFVRGLRSMGRL